MDEMFFVHITGDSDIIEFTTLEDVMKDVDVFVADGTPRDDILVIRGVALRVTLALKET